MLKKQKGNMYEFVTHMWSPVRGKCSHDCSYCHPAGTKIRMTDYTLRNIEDIVVGDEVLGIQKENGIGFYKFVRTKVVDHSLRMADTLEFETSDGSLICTEEHPLMGSTASRNGSDWKSARSFAPYENLRFVSNLDSKYFSLSQRLGYLKGIRDGDGCVFKHYNLEGKEYLGFEIVVTDKSLENKIKSEFRSALGIELLHGIKRSAEGSYGSDSPMLHTRKSKDVEKLEKLTEFKFDMSFAKGYIAGMLDTDGSVGKQAKVIRISQSEKVNGVKYDNVIKCCDLLGLEYVEEGNMIRIKSNFETRMRLLFEFGMSHSEKRDNLIIGSTVKGCKHSLIKSIAIHKKETVYNLQTESENFISNGFIVHNCYMKRSLLPDLYLDEKDIRTHLGEGKFIFVGHTVDLFANDVPEEWIDRVLFHLNKFPMNKYLLQSKNPMRFHRFIGQYPPNVLFGTTVETNRTSYVESKAPPYTERVEALRHLREFDYSTMITIEPILDFDLNELVKLVVDANPEWVNIGADSKGHNLPEPSKEKVDALIEALQDKTEVKLKGNLVRLTGEDGVSTNQSRKEINS